MSQDAPAESGQESGARCVLWHAKGGRPPAELLGALARRGLVVRAVQSSYAALAELCMLDAASRQAILLLVEPATLTDPQDALEVARRYTPGAVLWVYEQGANKQLRELVEERPARPARAPTRGHALRLSGEGPEQTEDWPEEEQEMAHVLTDEELAMLLDEPRAGGSADVD